MSVELGPDRPAFGGARSGAPGSSERAGPAFSLFFFSSDGEEKERGKYEALLEIAAFADERGFEAVWTPERHFHRFGGLFPNPSVLSAAIAARTNRIGIRAGSLSLPFHHPIRVAEDWSVVDNLSGGRAGLSVTYGWHPKEYVLAPELYEIRREAMFERLGVLRKLWRGEPVAFPAGGSEYEIARIYPPPVQRELPVWITTARTRDTWRRAGEIGANVLTALYAITPAELEENMAVYRSALREGGHSGGKVTLMLHTFLGDDPAEVRATVREPMIRYLIHHTELYDPAMIARELRIDPAQVGERHRRALAQIAFERYWNDSALFGTVETCSAKAERLFAAGIDEIACLIDFGVQDKETEASLERIDLLRRKLAASAAKERSGAHG